MTHILRLSSLSGLSYTLNKRGDKPCGSSHERALGQMSSCPVPPSGISRRKKNGTTQAQLRLPLLGSAGASATPHDQQYQRLPTGLTESAWTPDLCPSAGGDLRPTQHCLRTIPRCKTKLKGVKEI
uniref:Uncharacterized protein n=1 Tax=Micrurus lemniscatus lemniscatus TaxID=129467 RepID=A0A2D4J5I9_MICLE